MSAMQRAPALLDPLLRDTASAPSLPGRLLAAQPDRVALSLAADLAAVSGAWKAFEREADCTVFQTFAWLSAWMDHVAPHQSVTPAIVLGRDPAGALLFILPLAVEKQALCRALVWLGTDLNDYNAPLLAKDFAARIGNENFPAMWREVLSLLRRDARYRPDAVLFEKMPETVGAQANPFMTLSLAENPNGAHRTRLLGSWEEFYEAKRSSETRRHDRSKRKRLGKMGEVRMTTPAPGAESRDTLVTLIEQKTRAFARMGVHNLFGRPGYDDFFRGLAADASHGDLVHISRLDVGETVAAANFGLVHNRCYYHILASYDEGPTSKYGPGAAHLHDLMAYAIGRGCEIYDFTIGDEEYKRAWSEGLMRLKDHRAVLTPAGVAGTLPVALVAAVKRVAKHSPRVWGWTLAARAFLGRFRRAEPAE